MSTPRRQPEPDEKDWTWVLDRPCPACGLVAGEVKFAELGGRTRDAAARFGSALSAPGAAARSEPTDGALRWSTLEYGCHVRDVCRVFDQRLALMLARDDPAFENWDQDATALAERYWAQQPAVVSTELTAAADRVADRFEAVRPDQLARGGRRSNGSSFTVESLGRYFLHDLVHHLHDVLG
jgi:hypothetical protein